jgi:3-hydroxybutyryl-CoA dehydrogenase
MTKTIRQVAVLGAGTMGTGIAAVAARAGHHVVLYDLDDTKVSRGIEIIRAFFAKSVELGKMTTINAEEAARKVVGSVTMTDLASSEVVIEAIFEDLAVKKDLLPRVEALIGAEVLIHTNTSTLSVTAIASCVKKPERVVGTHYCNPAPLMKLVELADGRHTAHWAHDHTREFLEGMGQIIVVTKDRPGFILNRFLIPWENSCIRALETGLGTVESIDAAVPAALGHPMGPFRLLDIVGMDVHHQVASRLYEQLRDPRFAPPPMVERMIAAGDLGRKTGRGFYTYGDKCLFGS